MVVPGRYEVRLTVGGETLPPAADGEARSAPECFDGGVAAAVGSGAEDRRRAWARPTRATTRWREMRAQLDGRLAALKQSGKSPETVAAAKALDTKAPGLTDAAGPPAGLRAHESRPDALTDRGGPVRHAAGQLADRDVRGHVPGHQRGAGALERSSHRRTAATQCAAGATIGTEDRGAKSATGHSPIAAGSWAGSLAGSSCSPA